MSEKRFKVGDRVVIARSPHAERIGQVATVMSGLEWRHWQGETSAQDRPMHRLDLRPLPGALPTLHVGYQPDHLEPYRGDGQEKAEWTEELRRLCGAKVDA